MEWTKDSNHADYHIIREGISVDESQNSYQKWGEKGDYDELVSPPSNNEPIVAFKKAVESVDIKKDALFLDIGAGSGLTGQALCDMGYTKLHALDPCTSFCEQARAKGIYSKILQEFIGGDGSVSAPDDTYDAIVSTRAFGPGHIPSTAITEIVRLVKSGGYVILCFRKEFLTIHPDYKDNMVPLMEKLVTDKKWELISWTTYEQHFVGKDGLAITYRVC